MWLNSIAREVFRNGAAAVAGMAHAYRPTAADGRPLVLVSTLGEILRVELPGEITATLDDWSKL